MRGFAGTHLCLIRSEMPIDPDVTWKVYASLALSSRHESSFDSMMLYDIIKHKACYTKAASALLEAPCGRTNITS